MDEKQIDSLIEEIINISKNSIEPESRQLLKELIKRIFQNDVHKEMPTQQEYDNWFGPNSPF